MEEPIIFQVRETEGYRSIRDASDAYNYFKQFNKSANEMFFVMYLNSKNVPIKTIRHSVGTVNASAVFAREIVKTALYLDASSVILAHNHPSGDSSPSINDTEVTKQIVYALRFLEIKVLDHVIIGNEKYGRGFYSYGDRGLIDAFEENFRDIMAKAEIGGINRHVTDD